MKSKLAHLYLHVSELERSFKFYKEMLELLDFKEMMKEEWGFAFIQDGTSIFFEKALPQHLTEGYHRKRVGLNHLAFRVNSKQAVHDFTKQFLEKNSIKPLYESPKAWPEYEPSYYAVYFEDPDRIKLEVAYYD